MPTVYPPKISTFLIADAIRREVHGKITIIGAFAGGQILLAPGSTFPAALPLAFFTAFTEGEGNFKARLRIFDPNNNRLGNEVEIGSVTKLPDQPMQLMVNFNVLPFPMSGTYKIEVSLDDRVYTEHISISISPKPFT